MARNGDIVFEIGGDTASLVSAGKRGETALKVMEDAARKAEAQIKKLERQSTDFQKAVQSNLGMDKLAKSARESALAFEKLAKAQDQMDSLRASIDPLYAASKRYEQALYQLDNALEAGAISAAQHERMVEMVGQAYLTTGNQATIASGKLGSFGAVMQRNRGAVQMFGYQIQDVAVQLAAGTAATTVFAQQGSQMLSAFGAGGAVLGALAAITLPLLGAALASAEEEVRTFDEAMAALQDRTDALRASQEILGSSLPELIETYGRYALAIRQVTVELLEMQSAEAKAALSQSIVEAADALEYFTGKSAGLMSAGESVGQVYARLSQEFGITTEQARHVYEAFRQLETAASFEDHVAAIQQINTALSNAGISAERLPGPVRQFLINAGLAAQKAAELDAELNRGEATARRLAGAGPKGGWLAGAIADAASLAGSLWNAVSATYALQRAMPRNNVQGGRGGDPRAFVDDPYWSDKYFPDPAKMNFPSGGGGGGGGGGSDPFTDKWEALEQSFKTEAELQLAAYEEQQALLDEALERKLISQQEYAARAEEMQREHAAKMSEIDVWRYGSSLEKAEAFFGDMASAMQGGNDKMLRIGKAFGAAQALIDAWQAHNQVLKDPRLPWFAKIGAAAKILASGMNAVKAIRNVGEGGGSASARGGSAAATPAQLPVQNVTVEWLGPQSMFNSMDALINTLNEAGRRGYRLNTTLVQGAVA